MAGILEQAYDLIVKTFLGYLDTFGESSPATAEAAKNLFVVLGGRRDRGEDFMPQGDLLHKLEPFAKRMAAGQL